ncbi:hypothetical protein [Streptomyces cyaneofuscatus]|uniref:hypothetical protein n=1 Tax=Streptomyces cyaneofuscatus TaxID=66883 RepID=UPI0037994D34
MREIAPTEGRLLRAWAQGVLGGAGPAEPSRGGGEDVYVVAAGAPAGLEPAFLAG